MTVDEVRKLINEPALGGQYAEPYRAQRATDTAPGAEKAADQAAAYEVRRVEAMERSAQADLIRAQNPPVFNVPAPVVNVAAPSITVEAPIVNIAPPQVNVAAPEVNVEAVMPSEPPVVNVAAPHVSVEVPASNPAPVLVVNEVKPADVSVSLPDRERTTTVERDSRGEIVRTVTIETDA